MIGEKIYCDKCRFRVRYSVDIQLPGGIHQNFNDDINFCQKYNSSCLLVSQNCEIIKLNKKLKKIKNVDDRRINNIKGKL